MSTPPLITIFVRHSKDCKYAGDEFCKRCRCRKHMRWTQNGKQYRRKANTRSWEEAEQERRWLEDQLAGRIPTTPQQNAGQPIDAAVKLFLQDKTTQGLSGGVLDKYSRELERLRKYCECAGAFVVQAITKEVLSGYCAT
jgi:integrase/recombinase XerD